MNTYESYLAVVMIGVTLWALTSLGSFADVETRLI
jgi:hypothetical protein